MSELKPGRRPNPPDEMSFAAFVTSRWDDLRPAALKNRDISFDITLIERKLTKGRAAQASGDLQAGLDWERDLSLSEDYHALNLRWLNSINSNNSVVATYWKDLAKRQIEISTAMMISGVNLIIAGHGATAIAALNALVSDRGEKFEATLIWTIFGACVGLMLVTGGKVLAIEWLSDVSTKISSKLTFPSPLRLRAIGKYVGKAGKRPSKLIPWLLYGSIVWFVFYVFVALVLIANSR